jgi:hypothetical protein
MRVMSWNIENLSINTTTKNFRVIAECIKAVRSDALFIQ